MAVAGKALSVGVETEARSLRHPGFLAVAVALVAANLRPALASVGPVLSDIRADLRLSAVEAALLTAVPVLCLGVVAASAPALARRRGMEPVVAVALACIGAGLLLRIIDGVPTLFLGTMIASGAIAVANVLIPALIKRDFPTSSGLMMGVYTMALSGSAAVGAGATVPIGNLLGQGWHGALGAWAVPAFVALLIWVPFARAHTAPPPQPPGRSLLREALAWHVTLFFGLQSLAFYAVLAWVPSVYRDAGYDPAFAGWLLSVSALVQIPIALLLPHFAARAKDQRTYATACTLLTATGLLGVTVAPTAAPYVWMVLLGVGQGGAFAVALLLIVVRTREVTQTARLSAMTQTFGYLLAAAGPLIVGMVRDVSGSWTAALGVLLALLVPQLVFGVLAGRHRYVGGPDAR